MSFKDEWAQFEKRKQRDKELMEKLKRKSIKRFDKKLAKEKEEVNGLLRLPTEQVCDTCAYDGCGMSEDDRSGCDAWTKK